jgi:hypothetical protein
VGAPGFEPGVAERMAHATDQTSTRSLPYHKRVSY